MPSQCDDYWGDQRCQLVDGHNSAHAAYLGASLLHWRGQLPAEQARLTAHEWWTDDEADE